MPLFTSSRVRQRPVFFSTARAANPQRIMPSAVQSARSTEPGIQTPAPPRAPILALEQAPSRDDAISGLRQDQPAHHAHQRWQPRQSLPRRPVGILPSLTITSFDTRSTTTRHHVQRRVAIHKIPTSFTCSHTIASIVRRAVTAAASYQRPFPPANALRIDRKTSDSSARTNSVL